MSETQHQDLSGILNTRSAEELSGANSLGSGSTKYVYSYDPSLLETFVNKHQDNDYVITFDCTEGTSLCPKTHQPDFFKAVISYIPRKLCVESKSLKLYLGSFRNTGSFHEDVCNTVGKDLVKLLDPRYLECRMIYSVRGGIAIYPSYTYADDSGDYDYIVKQRKLDLLRDGSNRTIKYDI